MSARLLRLATWLRRSFRLQAVAAGNRIELGGVTPVPQLHPHGDTPSPAPAITTDRVVITPDSPYPAAASVPQLRPATPIPSVPADAALDNSHANARHFRPSATAAILPTPNSGSGKTSTPQTLSFRNTAMFSTPARPSWLRTTSAKRTTSPTAQPGTADSAPDRATAGSAMERTTASCSIDRDTAGARAERDTATGARRGTATGAGRSKKTIREPAGSNAAFDNATLTTAHGQHVRPRSAAAERGTEMATRRGTAAGSESTQPNAAFDEVTLTPLGQPHSRRKSAAGKGGNGTTGREVVPADKPTRSNTGNDGATLAADLGQPGQRRRLAAGKRGSAPADERGSASAGKRGGASAGKRGGALAAGPRGASAAEPGSETTAGWDEATVDESMRSNGAFDEARLASAVGQRNGGRGSVAAEWGNAAAGERGAGTTASDNPAIIGDGDGWGAGVTGESVQRRRAVDGGAGAAATGTDGLWPELEDRKKAYGVPGNWPELLDDAQVWAPPPPRADLARVARLEAEQKGRPWNA
jgi:hypothetical protein